MAQVVWSGGAINELDAIVAYVEQFSPLAAQSMAVRLKTAAESPVAFPSRGRTISRNRRELTVVPPYLNRYRVLGERVIILEIRHGAREPE